MAKENVIQISPSPGASTKIAEFYMLMEDVYDKQAKAYRSGWSDERMSKETGLSANFVSSRRAADYGPAPEPKPEPLAEVAILAKPLTIELADALSTIKALGDKVEVLADRVRRIAAVAASGGKTSA